jgi:(p)ppGpp synthase/HD superfamily hydrolase
MLYGERIKDAVKFSIKTHEVYQKQKRKGKDIPYITHPLTVGLILAHAGGSEDVIIAGLLHDTIEDSTKEKKVTKEMLSERFGDVVAQLVMSVTEDGESASWSERKKEAREHIAHYSHDALLLKSADTISNVTELLDDHNKAGDETFARFAAPRQDILSNYRDVADLLHTAWPTSPLAKDLISIRDRLDLLRDLYHD